MRAKELNEQTKELVKTYGLEQEYERVNKIARKNKARVIIFIDFEDGNPENLFFTAEIISVAKDGYDHLISNFNLDELLREVEEFFNEQ